MTERIKPGVYVRIDTWERVRVERKGCGWQMVRVDPRLWGGTIVKQLSLRELRKELASLIHIPGGHLI